MVVYQLRIKYRNPRRAWERALDVWQAMHLRDLAATTGEQRDTEPCSVAGGNLRCAAVLTNECREC